MRFPRGSNNARQEALQKHLFGANFTKVAPFAAPAAATVAAALTAKSAKQPAPTSEESRLKARTQTPCTPCMIAQSCAG